MCCAGGWTQEPPLSLADQWTTNTFSPMAWLAKCRQCAKQAAIKSASRHCRCYLFEAASTRDSPARNGDCEQTLTLAHTDHWPLLCARSPLAPGSMENAAIFYTLGGLSRQLGWRTENFGKALTHARLSGGGGDGGQYHGRRDRVSAWPQHEDEILTTGWLTGRLTSSANCRPRPPFMALPRLKNNPNLKLSITPLQLAN